MKSSGYRLLIALLIAATLPTLFLVTGCELSGHYHDDNMDVQFGNTNAASQAHTQ